VLRAVDPPARLAAHLTDWLGAWPPPADGSVLVVGSERRVEPAWDGQVRPVNGIATPTGTVLSVPPAWVDAVRALGPELEPIRKGLPSAVGRPGAVVGAGIFRWSGSPTPGPDAGEWVPTEDGRVPEWLKPFNGDVLIAWDDDGRYGAGVGRKQHDRWGHELSVGTEEALRGRGMARRLVATAARRVLDDGAVPTYLHAPSNVASAHVAEASGFPEIGWRVLGLFGVSLPEP
jgi:GNAT superfamily N-acetyltransferase